VRRNITLALAVVITIAGRCVALSDDLHGETKGSHNQVAVAAEPVPASTNPTSETYRGYLLDLTEITGRDDVATIVDSLRRQIDIVESVGLSQRVLQSFHTVPILVDEFGCLDGASTPKSNSEKPVNASACYGSRVPGKLANNEDISHGVVEIRPATLRGTLGSQGPVVLNELLHFYHAHIFPEGVEEPAIRFYYASAKTAYEKEDGYFLTNAKEFFAVTASIFLYGKDNKEPFTRARLKEKQPEYYNYLVWLFGFDPGERPASPLASTD